MALPHASLILAAVLPRSLPRVLHPALAPALALALLAPAARTQLVDALMDPGDSFAGEIDAADDVDLVQLDSVAGSRLSVKLGASKGSGLVPSLRLIDSFDSSVVAEATAAKGKLSLKSPELPHTGSYQLRITGTSGSTGAYLLKFKEKLSKGARKITLDATVDAAGSLELPFAAAAGFELTAQVQRRNKKSAADPALPTLSDPAGQPVVLDAASVKSSKKGDKFVLKRIPLESTGEFVLAAANEGGSGELRARINLRRQKPARRKLVELPLGETGSVTLAGKLTASGAGVSLAGVTVTVHTADNGFGNGESVSVQTDVDGVFVIQDPPAGSVCVTLDGATQSSDPGDFGRLELPLVLADDGPSELPRVMALPRLSDPAAARHDGLSLDAAGASLVPISATSASLPLSLAGPTGTVVSLNGSPAAGSLDLLATPMPTGELPLAPTDGAGAPLDPTFALAISPAEVGFDSNPANPGSPPAGLDLVVPNARGFPPGALLDVWSLDSLSGQWINRSEQTGQQAVVSPDGLSLSAPDVVLGGGLYLVAGASLPACATTLTGHVQDAATGAPLVGVGVSTDQGARGSTDVNGDFVLSGVPAYDPASTLPACNAVGLTLRLDSPVAGGALSSSIALGASTIVPGGQTDLGTLILALPDRGLVVGRVIDNGFPIAAGSVSLQGPIETSAVTDADGRFFLTDLLPGSYVGSFLFVGAEQPSEVAFAVPSRGIATIAIQRAGGQGNHDVTVRVVAIPESGSQPPQALAGVQVVLVGSDAFSSAGLTATTNAQGKAQFQSVDPPYTVSAASVQTLSSGESLLASTSVFAIDPGDDTVGVPIRVRQTPSDPFPDALISGSIANIPAPTFDSETFYDVLACSADPLFPYQASIEADFDGLFDLDVPAGHTWNVVLRERTIVFGDFSDTEFQSGAMFELGVADPGAGGTTLVDFDLAAPDFIPFDQQVSLSYQGLPAPTTVDTASLRFFLDAPDIGIESLPLLEQIDQVFGDDTYLPPASLLLPDPGHPALSGFRQTLAFEHEGSDPSARGAGCELVYEAGTLALTIDLTGVPVLSHPSLDELFSLSQAEGLTLQWFDQSAPSDRGWVSIELEAGTLADQLGVDRSRWELIVPLGAGAASLPPTARPALAEGFWNATLRTFGVTGAPFEYDSAFTEMVDLNLAQLPAAASALCSGQVVHPFEIVPD